MSLFSTRPLEALVVPVPARRSAEGVAGAVLLGVALCSRCRSRRPAAPPLLPRGSGPLLRRADNSTPNNSWSTSWSKTTRFSKPDFRDEKSCSNFILVYCTVGTNEIRTDFRENLHSPLVFTMPFADTLTMEIKGRYFFGRDRAHDMMWNSHESKAPQGRRIRKHEKLCEACQEFIS